MSLAHCRQSFAENVASVDRASMSAELKCSPQDMEAKELHTAEAHTDCNTSFSCRKLKAVEKRLALLKTEHQYTTDDADKANYIAEIQDLEQKRGQLLQVRIFLKFYTSILVACV